jgi:NADP-reducing hydrogenase subunit HndB
LRLIYYKYFDLYSYKLANQVNMGKINSLADLIKRKEQITAMKNISGANASGNEKTRIRVHMGTSGLASGAKDIYDFLLTELDKRNILADVVKTGDLGYSFAEPTIEVKRPGEDPVVFGNVDKMKADEIIEKYIRKGQLVGGILPANYRTIN